MVGVPYNPDRCAFIANQALNANQFRAVPNAANLTNHLVLWDFIDEKLYWVNSLTNIIEYELPDSSSGENEEYSKLSVAIYNLNTTPTVYGANYLVLPAGTYMFDLQYSYIYQNFGPSANNSPTTAQIVTNTNPLLTSKDASDVLIKFRQTKCGLGDFDDEIVQTVKTEAVTFANEFIVKSVFSFSNENTVNAVTNLLLRAFKI